MDFTNTVVLVDRRVREYALTSKASARTGLGIKERDHDSSEKLVKAMNKMEK